MTLCTEHNGREHKTKAQGPASGFRAMAENRQFHLRNGSMSGESRQDGGARSHKAGRRLAPTRSASNMYIHSVSEIRFED